MSTEFYGDDFFLSTSPIVEDREVLETKGIVVANVTMGRHVGKDFLANIRDTFGGRSKSWENTLRDTQKEAIKELISKAEEIGANGIIALNIVDESVTEGIKNVKVTGTAVRID